MATQTEIVNLALSLLGQPPVTSLLDPKTTVEQLAQLQYPVMRDAVLEEVEWSFAIARFSSSTPSATSPDWGYTYRYTVPTNVLRVLYCSDKTDERAYNANFHWTFEDNHILTDAEKIYYRAVVREEDTTKYSTLFVQALAARLAMEMCIEVTENAKLHASLVQLYGTKMQAASTMDNMQGKSTRLRVGRLNSARGGI